MGWNTLNARRPHPLLDGIAVGPSGLHAYFVHSFHLKPAERADLVAEADYGGPVTRHRRPRHHGRHPVPPGEEPAAGAAADRQFPEVEAVILFPAIDLKDGLAVRLEQGDMARATVFQPRSGGAGAGVRGAGLRISAHRRSRRRLCRQAGQPRRRSSAIIETVGDPGAARRRHPRPGDDRRLARPGRRPRDHRHRRGARSGAGQGAPRENFPRASPSASTRATARSRSTAGRRPPSLPRSTLPGVSRMPASRPSSTPTLPATACSRASTSTPLSRSPRR